MKVKELQKSVNIAWSPLPLNPIYLAAGTAAQQFDYNGNSTLEIYSTNINDPGYDLELKACLPSQYRFQKLIWSPTDHGNEYGSGLLVGGCEGGHIMLYSAAKMFAGEDGLVALQDKHTGTINGLDYNPFQTNLLASVASESEIFIWDLNNTSSYMNPGTKTQPLEDVKNIAWNRQVQHILASVFSTRCVIWDLRKSEQIMKLSDTQSRVRWHAIQWHPDVATQVWLASDDDKAPMVQLWDLRYATSPSKSIHIHQRGVLGMSWCPHDSNLMVSCGKDNHIYCWNPNTEIPEGEILSEVATTATWYSDVQWCPRNPALIASSSLDGNVSIYSLFGGAQQQVHTSKKIADSFPGMDQLAQAPISRHSAQIIYHDLKQAPKWMKPQSGVSFGFGGKLIEFNMKSNCVSIFRVVTEPDLVERANALKCSLGESNFPEYCRQRAHQLSDQNRRYIWYFIKANFHSNPKEEMLNLLGYNKEDMENKFAKYIKQVGQTQPNVSDLSDSSEVKCDQGRNEGTNVSETVHNTITSIDDIAKTRLDSDNKTITPAVFKIPSGTHADGLISEALLIGDLETAVELCMQSNRTTEALIIASMAGIEFLTSTQNRYLENQSGELLHVISALVSRDWIDFVSSCTIDSWKEALVATLKHSDRKFDGICEKLGDRLLFNSDNVENIHNAMICFICAGSINKLVKAWYILKQSEQKIQHFSLSIVDLQELAEVVMIMRKSLEQQGFALPIAGTFADFIVVYIGILASQGALTSALAYIVALGPNENSELGELRERIYNTVELKGESNRAQKQQNIYNRPKPQQRDSTLSQQAMSSPILGGANSFQNQFQSNSWNSASPKTIASTHPIGSINSTSAPSDPTLNSIPPMLPPINNQPLGVSCQAVGVNSRSKYILDPSVVATCSTNLGSYGVSAPISQPLSFMEPATLLNAYNSTQLAQQSIALGSKYLPEVSLNEHSQQLQMSPPIAQRKSTPPPGWNDPPALQSSKLLKKAEASFIVAPITHPIFGVDSNQNRKAYMDSNASYQIPSNPATHPLPLSTGGIFCSMPQNNEMAVSGYLNPIAEAYNYSSQYQHQNYHTSEIFQQLQKWNSQVPPQLELTQQTEPTQKQLEVTISKLSLQEEYVYLQTIFEELKTHCLAAASDTRTKRKFVDVAKRLENLNDCLRDGRLAPPTIAALNEIGQYIKIGDYGNALKIQTSIAFGSDFSQCAGFMTGLKVLIQSAADLHVHLKQ